MGYETDNQEVPEGFTHLGENSSLKEISIGALAESDSSKSPTVYYPELHFEGDHAAHLIKHLPKNGTAQVHFKKISESTHHLVDSDGKEKTRHRVGIQIHGIKPEKSTNTDSSRHVAEKENPEDSIEKGLEAAESESNS